VSGRTALVALPTLWEETLTFNEQDGQIFSDRLMLTASVVGGQGLNGKVHAVLTLQARSCGGDRGMELLLAFREKSSAGPKLLTGESYEQLLKAVISEVEHLFTAAGGLLSDAVHALYESGTWTRREVQR